MDDENAEEEDWRVSNQAVTSTEFNCNNKVAG
jgi:hypothetical protein